MSATWVYVREKEKEREEANWSRTPFEVAHKAIWFAWFSRWNDLRNDLISTATATTITTLTTTKRNFFFLQRAQFYAQTNSNDSLAEFKLAFQGVLLFLLEKDEFAPAFQSALNFSWILHRLYVFIWALRWMIELVKLLNILMKKIQLKLIYVKKIIKISFFLFFQILLWILFEIIDK